MERRLFMRTISALVIFILMVLPIANAELPITPAETFESLLSALNAYLGGGSDSVYNITEISNELDEVKGSSEYGLAFYIYSQVLACIETGNYEQAAALVSQLQRGDTFGRFNEYIATEKFHSQYPQIRSVSEMSLYLIGRQYEDAMLFSDAADAYSSCLNFFDSYERWSLLPKDTLQSADTPAPTDTPAPEQNQGAHKVGVPAIRREEFENLALRTGPHTEYSWVGMYGGDFSALELEKTTEYNKDTGEYDEFTWVLVEYNNDGKVCRAYTGLKRMILNENIPWASHENIPAQVRERTTVLAAPSSNAGYRWIKDDGTNNDYTQAVVGKNQQVTVLEFEDGYAYIEFMDDQTNRKTRGYILSSYLV